MRKITLHVEILTEDDEAAYSFKRSLERLLDGETVGAVTIEAVEVYVQDDTQR